MALHKHIYFCFIDYAKAFDYVNHNTLWKILQEMGIPDHLPASWETCMKVKKQQLEPDMERRTGSNLGKEYVKAIYCHPAYLTYIQSTSLEMLGWMKLKLESGLPGEITVTSDMQMTPPRHPPPIAESKEELNSLLKKVKEESEKADLKLNMQKTKIMVSGPIASWQIDGKQWKQWQTLFSWPPKSLRIATAAVKLKDAYSMKENILWENHNSKWHMYTNVHWSII